MLNSTSKQKPIAKHFWKTIQVPYSVLSSVAMDD